MSIISLNHPTLIDPARHFNKINCPRCKNNTFKLCHALHNGHNIPHTVEELNIVCDHCNLFYIGYGVYNLYFHKEWRLCFDTIKNKSINYRWINDLLTKTELPLLPFDITLERLEQLLILV